MVLEEKILTYLTTYGKENKYKLARALKTDVAEVIKALDMLEQAGKIETKEGKAMLVKEQSKEEHEEEKPEEIKTELVKEKIAEEEKLEGTVKFYNQNKGFGFIRGDDGKEYYVHENGLKEGVTIDADDRVSFKVIQDPKGLKAEEVEKKS